MIPILDPEPMVSGCSHPSGIFTFPCVTLFTPVPSRRFLKFRTCFLFLGEGQSSHLVRRGCDTPRPPERFTTSHAPAEAAHWDFGHCIRASIRRERTEWKTQVKVDTHFQRNCTVMFWTSHEIRCQTFPPTLAHRTLMKDNPPNDIPTRRLPTHRH